MCFVNCLNMPVVLTLLILPYFVLTVLISLFVVSTVLTVLYVVLVLF